MRNPSNLRRSRAFSPSVAQTLFALLFFALSPLRAEEWRLIYAVTHEQSVNDSTTSAAPPSEKLASTLTLTVGLSLLRVDDGQNERVYDFAHRRFLLLNSAKRDYRDWSLYSNLGARINELQNRFAIHAGFRALNQVPQDTFGRYDNETNLGLELPGMTPAEPEPTIERKELAGGGWEFWHDGTSVVQYVPAKGSLPAAFYPRFASFLTYECNLYPTIRGQLVSTGEIPQLLVTRSRLGNQVNLTTYRLRSAELSGSDRAILPADFKPVPPQGESSAPVFQAISLIHQEGRATHRATRADIEHFAKEAIAQHRPLDAYLALLEYRLQSGERHANDFLPYQKEFDRDERYRRYVASSDQSNKEACRKSLASCDSIDRTGLQKAYMLDLHRADLLQALGRGRGDITTAVEQQQQAMAAEKLFLTVLTANPFLAGAYHDLGALYDQTFRSEMAWLCFDTGRRLSPDHFLFKDITNLEQRFEHDFPDFF